jgi:hypothetical protein
LGEVQSLRIALNINHHAAASGLFHLAYAVLDGRVRHSLFLLRKSRDASIKPEEFQHGMFGKRLEELRKELEFFRHNMSLKDEVEHQDVKEELQALERACEHVREVANWRNARIHSAQIRIVEDQNIFVLCDESGAPLLMDYSECEAKNTPSCAYQHRDAAEHRTSRAEPRVVGYKFCRYIPRSAR